MNSGMKNCSIGHNTPLGELINVSKQESASAVTASASTRGSGDYVHQNYGYQVTVNKVYDGTEEEESPPSLPPRNYRTSMPVVGTERVSSKAFDRTASVGGSDQAGSGDLPRRKEHGATPKEDSYASQLRKISQSHSSLFPAKYQSKRVPEMKPNISVSRPVDKPPVAQEAKAPAPTMYRSANMAADLNYAGLSDNSADASKSPQSIAAVSSPDNTTANANSSFESNSTTSPRHPTDGLLHQQHSPRGPSHHHPKNPKLSVLVTNATSPPATTHSASIESPSRDDVPLPPQPTLLTPSIHGNETPLPPPPSSAEIREAGLRIKGDDASPSYSSESYMYKRGGNIRQGFGGNYRRSLSGGEDTPLSPVSTPPIFGGPTGINSSVGSAQSQSAVGSNSAEIGDVRITSTERVDLSRSAMTSSTIGGSRFSTSSLSSSSSLQMEPSPGYQHDRKQAEKENSRPYPKPYLDPPWSPGQRTFYPAVSNAGGVSPPFKQSPDAVIARQSDSPNNGGDVSSSPAGRFEFSPNATSSSPSSPGARRPSPSRSDEHLDDSAESPSVRNFVANFETKEKEGMSPRLPHKSHVTRTKVHELRATLLRRSNESLEETADLESVSPNRSSDSTGSSRHSVGKSNENLTKAPFKTSREKLKSNPGIEEYKLPELNQMQSTSVKVFVKDKQSVSPSSSSRGTSVDNSPRVNGYMDQNGYKANSSNTSLSSTSESASISPNKTVISPSGEPPPLPPKEPHRHHHDVLSRNSRELVTSSPPSSSPPKVSSADTKKDGHSPSSRKNSQDELVISHVRQKSLEEMEYDKQAAIVVDRLKEEDKQLSEVILPPPEHKTTTDYMSGLFDTKVNISRKPSFIQSLGRVDSLASPRDNDAPQVISRSEPASEPPAPSSDWTPPSVASLHAMREDVGTSIEVGTMDTMDRHKTELVSRLEKKLQILKEEDHALQQEIDDNEQLGKQVTSIVEQKVQSRQEFDKYKLYVDELDKVMYLLLKLSGRLARAENAVLGLTDDSSDKIRTMMTSKRDELSQKHEDAKLLKEGIDRRSNQVASYLQKYLEQDEFTDYEYFIKMKSKLKMERQEIEDKVKLGEEQLAALRKSMVEESLA